MPASNPTSVRTRYALVTGAGSGLGRAFSLRLAGEGWHVGVTDIDAVAAEQTLAAIVEDRGSGQVECLDVADADAWQRVVDKLRREWPRLDLLINNAGVCATGEIGQVPLDHYQQVLQVNFHGLLHGCHTLLPWLKETAPGGHIVNIASIFGLVAPPTMGAYNVSKAAVVALSETLYGELLPHHIGVTVVAPGFFASQLVDQGSFATDRQRQIAAEYTRNARVTPEAVVDHTLKAVDRRQLYVVLGHKARWIWRFKRAFPALFAQLIAWRYRRKYRQKSVDD